MRSLLGLCCGMLIFGCSPKPFQVKTLPKIGERTIADRDSRFEKRDLSLDEKLKVKYKNKKSPTFGIVKGQYRLPATAPYGKVKLESARAFGADLNIVTFESHTKDYYVEELPGAMASIFSKAINVLLDGGIKIKELSVSDALRVAEAERKPGRGIFEPSKVLPPSVDYLVSFYDSSDARGPVLVGRVIKSDGQLMAFRVLSRAVGDPLEDMIILLVKDTINRM